MNRQMISRGTSSGYRYEDAQTPSLYHSKCIPKKERAKSAPPRTFADREYVECDRVTQDEIWKSVCRNERYLVRKWEENWGFSKDYDQKGNLKPRKELPEKSTVYSEKSPNTTNQHIGRRVKSATARTMQRFERMQTDHRMKRNKDLLCCD